MAARDSTLNAFDLTIGDQGHAEVRGTPKTYNSRGQLIDQKGFGVRIGYGFSSTANDGRLQSRTDYDPHGN